MIPEAKLLRLVDRFAAVEAQLASGGGGGEFVKLSKEHAELAPVIAAVEAYRDVARQLDEAEAIVADTASDAEMRNLADEERKSLKERFAALERELKLRLLPRDTADSSSAIVEIRAGTGGDEAALFAADLLGMYQRYAQSQGWKTDLLGFNESDLGGVKEAVLEVQGQGAYAKLKFESGVHRVQRVPVTEAGGRIHTSAATVAVLPEPEEVDVQVDDKDLRIDVYRASGAGGQHVNKTESAVRITHLPTGIVVAQQEEKSQHKNKAKAMKLLKAKLFEAERARQASERAAERKGLVGSGDRSERIRTYNFPQGRVTDHRINLTLYKLDRILAGDDLGEVIEALVTEDQAGRLAELESPGVIAAREVWVGGAERLAAKGIESARLDARVLLAHAMNIEMVELLSARPPSSDEIARYGELLERRAAHEPVAYIVGEREFWSLRFEVGPGVLVPRPETETLLEETLRRFPERERSFDFLDFGTGSGCLLISGLRSYPRARGTGIDRSPAALDWARRNARLLGVDARCTWREGDWSSADGTFDIILANPPYVRATEELPPDIARYEPHEALFAGADGLDAYRALAPIIARALKPEGRAFLEIGAGQGGDVRTLLEAAGLEILATVPDLSGVPRCVIAGRAFG